jgi:tetratricopeptide (TPR) repeat protein
LSKLSKLKQEAYLAGKRRDWEEAVSIYERILEMDRNNPTLINELGDVCLRKGALGKAVQHFLAAAASYRSTGLQNNAVAIYKKILRHDKSNLNAHWFLAEIRAGQNLLEEGEQHALHFLSGNSNLTPDLKEIFLKRCVQLLALLPRSQVMLERVEEVFRFWTMPLERTRASLLLTVLRYEGGEQEEAQAAVEDLLKQQPDLVHYPEYRTWQQLLDPQKAQPVFADVNAIDLEPKTPGEDATKQAHGDQPATEDDDGGARKAPLPHSPAGAETSFTDLMDELPAGDGPEAGPGRDEEGRFEITTDGEGDVQSEGRDLLSEILSDTDHDLARDAASQVRTIASEIGERVGGADGEQDAARQYEMGMVYLEMGMFEQAGDCFAAATKDPEHALRSYEMWGITLMRAQCADEAVAVLEEGLRAATDGSEEQLGLVYHLGRAHEQAGRQEEAAECYGRAHELSPTFLDVAKRLSHTSAG